MKKISKVLAIVLVTALIVAFASISVIAAVPADMSFKTPPRTVYYEGFDTFDGRLYCDKSGMVITVTDSEGKTYDVSADEYEDIYMNGGGYALGEWSSIIVYIDDEGNQLFKSIDITVEENPVASVKVTKMPAKTEYYMDKDVVTKDNFTLDKLYETDVDTFDLILKDSGLTYDEFKEDLDNPAGKDAALELFFSEYNEVLMADTTGMEIEVTFKDGTTQTVTDKSEYVVYNGAKAPVVVGQRNGKVAEGANTFYVDVAGVTTDFDVTVKKSAPAEKPAPEKPAPSKKPAATNNKNPEIPNTDGGVSLAAAAVIALMSGCSLAIIPSKKK